jgi:hypothetical protein
MTYNFDVGTHKAEHIQPSFCFLINSENVNMEFLFHIVHAVEYVFYIRMGVES